MLKSATQIKLKRVFMLVSKNLTPTPLLEEREPGEYSF